MGHMMDTTLHHFHPDITDEDEFLGHHWVYPTIGSFDIASNRGVL